jgi:hypothetical protein
MELTAIEAEKDHHGGTLVAPEPTPCLTWYNVYFREEYFGHIPETILEEVMLYMGLAGGFDFNPATLTLRSLHRPDQYRQMVRKIVRMVHWANGTLELC